MFELANKRLEYLLINIPIFFSIWILSIFVRALFSSPESYTNLALSVIFYLLYYGSVVFLYSLLVILALYINSLSLKDTMFKVAILNIVVLIFTVILVVFGFD